MADLFIRIQVDNADANRKLVETDRNLDAISTSAGDASKSASGLETSLGKVAAVSAGIAALKIGFEGLSRFMGASLTSFSEQEDAVKKLTTALKAQGQATPQVISQYADLAAKFQNTTVFADELIGEMQGLLVQVGNVMPQDMAKALKAATDLSAGLGIDLRTATMLVGKAFAGETGTLARYGIVLGDVEEGADKTQVAIDAINKKFGGQAQAQLDTYSGKTANLGNKMDDLREQVGQLIVRGVGPLLDLFNRLPGPLQTILLALGALSVTLGPIAFGFASIASAVGPLIPMLSAGLTVAIGGVTGAFSAMAGFVTSTILPMITTALPIALRGLAALLTPPAGLVIAGILAVVAIWKNWETIGPIVKAVYDAVKMWLVDKFNAVVESIKTKVDAVTGFFKGMYDKVVGHSYVPDMIAGIASEFGKLDAVMVRPTMTAITSVSGLFSGLVTDVFSSLGAMLTGTQSFSDAWSDIWGSVKQTLFKYTSNILSHYGEKFLGGLISKTAGSAGGWTAALGTMTGGTAGVMGKITGIVMSSVGGWVGIAVAAFKGIKALWDGGFGRGGEEGVKVNPARDKWFDDRGGSVDSVGRLLAEKGLDGESARRMIEMVFLAKTMKDFGDATGTIDKILGRAHTGGLILANAIQRFHSGGMLGSDERVIIGQTGEGILNRRAMANLGAENLHAMNRGQAGGVMKDPETTRELRLLRADMARRERTERMLPDLLITKWKDAMAH